MYNLLNSFLFFFFLFSLFHHLPCALSQQEHTLCETMFHCGNITAGFPFSGGNRHESCGHSLLKLRCSKNTTSLIISNHPYEVLHIDEASKTLRLAIADLRDSFCNATFADATLPPEIFELSQMYKNLTVFHHCDSKFPYRSSYTCPGIGPIVVSETRDRDFHDSCGECFTVIVPKSFVPEEKELNMTNLESVLSKGFEVKVKKIDEKACQECSSNHGTHQPSGMFLI
ncbi:LEAF RUST 10 DISEASE-RESISTANCE LOCUS RECEPTOR-LIKE PROTEIN KINASE-like 2.8 [Brassica napus]|uniref:LEAF RUST 10 DISEASE-RESISTANCE LOCUS RECEPTOR-LIKE PROTEIN KINASE-like 2.8 n=1 Tax=Brassica napus TaxID=3708 RepID=UPI0020787ECF|nr:LEAF RUST 10 DISEASE-RESISTANCE LOCUS RECEPTOR-LIKE PROTEIN KINASE-like 2.8 [Brassica napus]